MPHKSGESFTGSASCKARKRLPLGVFQRLLRRLADTLLPHSSGEATDDQGRWYGHRVFIMDRRAAPCPTPVRSSSCDGSRWSSTSPPAMATARSTSQRISRGRTPRAKVVADLYRKRWTIETAFQELEATLDGEINTLGYPKAALFAFGVALVLYNLIARSRQRCATVHGERVVDEKVSGITALRKFHMRPLRYMEDLQTVLIVSVSSRTAHRTPDRLLLQRVVIPVQAVRPVMRTQVMPQVLHRIELRRVRRPRDRAHIAGHHHILTGVEARPVPQFGTACAAGRGFRPNYSGNRLTTSVFSVGMITADIAPVAAQTAAST